MDYLNAHPLNGAFLASKLDRLADLIAEQGEEMLRDAGLDIPSRAVSVILLIGDHGSLSVADIANMLRQPHQLVTQRAELLIKLALIERKNDPGDGRRKIVTLTAKGEAQLAILQTSLSETADAFAELFKQIECDLAAVALRATTELGRISILDRIKILASSKPKNTTTKKGHIA